VGPPLFDGHHQTVVREPVSIRIGHQEATVGRAVDERENRQRPAVGERSDLPLVLTAGISPGDNPIKWTSGAFARMAAHPSG